LRDQHQPSAALRLDIVIRGVVTDVAVNEPLAGLSRFPDHIVPLARTDIHGIRKIYEPA
jgi:hypothetical protein